MIGRESSPEPACRCRALIQQSWWQEVLENEDYLVVRADRVNSVVEVLTISVGSESETRHPFFLTVADIDWPGLLAHFSEPVVTKDGEDAAMHIHRSLLEKLHAMMNPIGTIDTAELEGSAR